MNLPDGLEPGSSMGLVVGIVLALSFLFLFVHVIFIHDEGDDEGQSFWSYGDFERKITGLECHQMERYVLDMEYQWDKVIEYHSFKCSDSEFELETGPGTVMDDGDGVDDDVSANENGENENGENENGENENGENENDVIARGRANNP